jgi:hypothetical protein
METLARLDELAALARRETAPAPRADLDAVLRLCRRAQAREPRLFWPAAASALAAAVILTACLFLNGRATASASSDPVARLFAPTQVELP